MTQPENRPGIDQHITFVYTGDLNASARFYEEILGLRLKLDQGACRIYHLCGESYIGLCKRDGLDNAPKPNVILTLVSADVDGWYARLSALGVAFEKPPSVNAAYQIYHTFLRDPNGYLIEIQRFLDPRWATIR